MQLIAPVTDYIPASILTTLNDIVIRGAADPERLAEVDWRGLYIGTNVRQNTGNQVITGVGFTFRFIIFIARIVGVPGNQFTIGFDDGTTSLCIFLDHADLMQQGNNRSITLKQAVGKEIAGYVSAIGADGFTITWDIVGAPEQIQYIYLCRP